MYVQVQFYKCGYYFGKASFPTKYSGNCKTFSHNTTPVALCHLMLPVKDKDHTTISQSRHRGGVAVQLYPCLIWALDGSGKETLYPLYLMRPGGRQGWSGWVWRGENLLPPQDFKPQTIQPMASHYTDYAIPVLRCSVNNKTANVLTTFGHVNATTVSVEKQ